MIGNNTLQELIAGHEEILGGTVFFERGNTRHTGRICTLDAGNGTLQLTASACRPVSSDEEPQDTSETSFTAIFAEVRPAELVFVSSTGERAAIARVRSGRRKGLGTEPPPLFCQ